MSYMRPMGDTTPADPNAPVAPSSPAPVAAPDPSLSTRVSTFVGSDTAKMGGAAAMAYHGYRRTGSIIWTALYALAGHTWPQYAVPVAIAQGFGKRRTCTTEE